MAFGWPASWSPAWVLIKTTASAAFAIISMIGIGRVIGPQEAGIATAAIAAFLVLDVLGAALFPDALVQCPTLTTRHLRSGATAAVLVGLVTAALLAGLGILLGAGEVGSGPALLMIALAPLLPLSAYSGTASGLAAREQRFRLLAIRVLLGQPLALGAGLAAAGAGMGAWAMVISQSVTTGVTFLLFATQGGAPRSPQLDRVALRELWQVAGPQVAALLVGLGRYRIFLTAAALTATQVALSQAHFAFRMVDVALAVVWQSLGRIGLPRLCAVRGNPDLFVECYGGIVQFQALLGLPLALGVALVAEDLVASVLGPSWRGTAAAAQVAGIAAAAGLLHGHPFSLFVAAAKAKRNLRISTASLAIPLILLALLRPSTAEGVALTWAAPSVIVTPVVAYLVLREVNRPPAWLLVQVAPACTAGLVMTAAVVLTQQMLSGAPSPVRLLVAAVVGGMVYSGTAWAALGMRHPQLFASDREARLQRQEVPVQ